MDCSETHKKRKPNGKPSGRKMVLEAGLEPAIGNPTSTSSWRVCQFHHPSTGCWTTARRLPKNRRSGKRKFARKTKPKENVLPKSIFGARNGVVRLGRCGVRGGGERGAHAMPHERYARGGAREVRTGRCARGGGRAMSHERGARARVHGEGTRQGRGGASREVWCLRSAAMRVRNGFGPVAEGLSFPVYFTA